MKKLIYAYLFVIAIGFLLSKIYGTEEGCHNLIVYGERDRLIELDKRFKELQFNSELKSFALTVDFPVKGKAIRVKKKLDKIGFNTRYFNTCGE